MSVSSSTSSSSSAGSPISFSGIASGLDTNSIITSLLQADQVPISNLQSQEANIQTVQAAVDQLETLVQTLGRDASTLSLPNTFNAVAATSSNTSVATVTTTSGAQPGVYSLSVSQLATAGKVASSAQSSATNALGLSGSFIINGHEVNVAASNSLTAIAQSINSANTGVTASIINGGQGNAYLTLTSSATGAANAVQLSDESGGVLSSLGLVTGSSSIRQSVTNGALSTSLSSSSTAVGSLMDMQNPTSGTFSINGVSVSANFATDSLSTIASNINAANAGVNATVVSSTNSSGATVYQLQIAGTSGTPTFSDPNGMLGALGVTQKSYGSVLVSAQDAKYTLDNVSLTSASNSITSAIPGATLTLLSGSASSPGTSTISLSTDTTGIESKISTFVTDYNAVNDFISQESQLNSSTYATGPLFGNYTSESVQSDLSQMLFKNVAGVSGSYTNLASLGFSVNQSGDLSVNQTTLSSALATNPSAVAAVFAATGTSTNASLSYVTSSSSTVSNGNPYEVNITQLATKGSYTAESAQTANSTSQETLTFSGKLFGSTSQTITLNSGNSLQDTINQINSDAALSPYVVASNNNGSLQITSLHYGTPGNFTVLSNQEAAANNSGIGYGSLGTTVVGQDVEGTINGEAATGSGQFLTGNSGNATTDGLEIQYTGSTLGAIGSVTYSNGIGSQLNTMIKNLTNSTTGQFASANNAYTQQTTDINTQIKQLQTQMQLQQTQLQTEFANMESAISALKQQSSSLSSLISGGTTSSSSSSSTSSTSSA